MIVVAANRSLLFYSVSQLVQQNLARRRNIPFKSREDRRGLHGPTDTTPVAACVRQEDCFGDESGEPEYHCERFCSENAELVGGRGETAWREDEIYHGKESPYRTEEEEVCFRGSPNGNIISSEA